MYFCYRTKMGILEHRCFHVYTLCWNPSESWCTHFQGEVREFGLLDSRTDRGRSSIPDDISDNGLNRDQADLSYQIYLKREGPCLKCNDVVNAKRVNVDDQLKTNETHWTYLVSPINHCCAYVGRLIFILATA